MSEPISTHEFQAIDVAVALEIIIDPSENYLKLKTKRFDNRWFRSHIQQLYISRIDYDGPADCDFPINAFNPTQIKNAIWR